MRTQRISDNKALLGDRVLLGAILLAAAAYLILGFQTTQYGHALSLSGGLFDFAVISYLLCKGSGITRYPLTLVLVGLVALQLQLGYGLVELHFGVVLVLVLLLVYLDWKIILLAAVLFSIHHVLFD